MNYVLQHNARKLKYKITMKMVDTFSTRVKRVTFDNTKVPNITVYVRERVNTQSLSIIYDGSFATYPEFCICQAQQRKSYACVRKRRKVDTQHFRYHLVHANVG